MYSVQLSAWSPCKILNSYPLNLYDYSSSTLKPTRYHHGHNENEGAHMEPKNLREMTQPASSLGVHGKGWLLCHLEHDNENTVTGSS